MADDFLVIKGEQELMANLQRRALATPLKIAAALYGFGSRVMLAAKRDTPWEFGVLRASGEVNKPVIKGRDISVLLQFGGPAAAYAIPVHENLEAKHPHGHAKFFETAVKAASPRMAEEISTEFDESWWQQ